jgi:hypothetical protein
MQNLEFFHDLIPSLLQKWRREIEIIDPAHIKERDFLLSGFRKSYLARPKTSS